MSILVLKSNNPYLSFIIQKRPPLSDHERSSDVNNPMPMLIKNLREGTLFGYYSIKENNTYVIHFHDGFDEISFKKSQEDEFEYLNVTRYNSSLFLSLAVKEYFGHLENNRYNDSEKDVDGYDNEIIINMVNVGIPKYLTFFKSSFPDFHLEESVQIGKNYKLIIKTNKSLHYLINYVNLLSIFLIMLNDNEYLFIEDAIIERYLRVLNTLNAPYYVRYLFKLKMLTNKSSLFLKYKEQLEKSKNEIISFKYGDTHMQRIEYISNQIDMNSDIIDVGCGEGIYAIKLAPKLNEDRLYYAIDIDQNLLDQIAFKADRKGIENIVYYNSFDSFYDENYETNEKYNIICTEVIEHMSINDAVKFIDKLISFSKNKPGSKLIITTPNADFNKYYFLTDKMRHDDHKWEFGKDEFQTFIATILLNHTSSKFNLEFVGIGDCVNNNYVTQGVIFKF